MNNWIERNHAEDLSLARSFRVTLRRPSGDLVTEVVNIDAEEICAHATRGPLMPQLRSRAVGLALTAHPDAAVDQVVQIMN
jgi:hypothetical protein